MKLLYPLTFIIALTGSCQLPGNQYPKQEIRKNLTATELQDKIKGGWAGQVIGCTCGQPCPGVRQCPLPALACQPGGTL